MSSKRKRKKLRKKIQKEGLSKIVFKSYEPNFFSSRIPEARFDNVRVPIGFKGKTFK